MQEPAANLSGGQQQMLTLAMALLSRPRLLMIDELSLGLAPSVVAELLVAVQRLKEQGTTVILVEQSVNVALTVAETAYFMEKGEIRFHGPTSELLERPDVLRSVFLEGAASVELAVDAPAVVHVNGDLPDVAASALRSAPTAQSDVRVRVRGVSKHFGGIAALDDVSLRRVRPARCSGSSARTAPARPRCSTCCRASRSRARATSSSRGPSITGFGPDARARLGLGRSFQDGRLFPALTVAETIAVALERSIDVRDPLAAALHLPSVVDSEAKVAERVEELIELLGLGAFRDKYIRELSTGSRRVVDLACVLAHGPRVLLLDEPSSGIAQREAEALGPLLLRIRAMTGASLLIIEHDIPLLTSIADRMIALDLGRVVTIGAPADVVRNPDVVASYLGESEAVVSRSGPRGG